MTIDAVAESEVAPHLALSSVEHHWQPGNLKEVIQVLQLNVPKAFRYSDVNQKVQSSTGSTVIAL